MSETMHETRTLLLEVHCEEIPARFLQPLHEEFGQRFAAWAVEQHLDVHTLAWAPLYSPRKLAWKLEGIPLRQPDQTEVQVGPPQRLCADEAGNPTIQGQKFAEKWGVAFGDVRFEQPAGKKEPCAVVTLTREGRATADLLSEALPRLIGSLHVPKAMRWGHSSFEFVRPIRNLLCLFGEEVVPFEVDGVRSAATTWGHRLHHRAGAGPVAVGDPAAYEKALEGAGVVASFEERRRLLSEQLDRLAREVEGRVVRDEELLTVLAEIVEFPTIVRGAFPVDFLQLPKEVLVTSLKEHQKSFCIENGKGELLPYFLAAANRPVDAGSEAERLVAGGNEWVLKARLYDARFFFAEDRKAPLEARLAKLEHLTFQRELGSYAAKSERLAALAPELAARLDLDAAEARQAARVCKADLRTLMVGEFPELQGVMGGEYLKREGAPEGVWKAVKAHYEPSSAEAPVPGTDLGCLVSLVDKLDTVVGCFAVGILPSGSKDPLALRRAGMGIVRILWERGWSLRIMDLVAAAWAQVEAKATQPREATFAALEAFFRDRAAYQLELAGYAGAVRRAGLATGFQDLVDLRARCEALSAFAEDERFASLGQSAKRIVNILKDEAPALDFDPQALQQPEEKALLGHLATLESTFEHPTLLAALAELAGPLEAFFTAVMVKCEDPLLRATRLSLLHRLRLAFQRVADFSQWQ